MKFISLYLLAGLVFHKLLWEFLKRGPATSPKGRNGGGLAVNLALVKAIKVLILLGIVAQTIWSLRADVLPISSSPGPLRWAGLFIFTIGLLTAITGRLQLGDNWSDIETARILNRQRVVRNGIYAYIRHPIYAGDLLLLIGLELSLNSWLVILALILAPIVFWKATREEKLLSASLPGYDDYCAGTKRFVPFLI